MKKIFSLQPPIQSQLQTPDLLQIYPIMELGEVKAALVPHSIHDNMIWPSLHLWLSDCL